jgi:hypothetical protein
MKTNRRTPMAKQLLKYLSLTLTLLTLAACGGGGGDSSSVPTTYTTATVRIALSGTLPANRAIAGAGFTLALPADVTPATTNGIIASSVVTPSGTFAGGALIQPVYTPATATTAGSVRIAVANAAPAGVTQVGEIATVTLKLANGAVPTAAAFTLPQVGVTVIDTDGNSIGGIDATVSGVTLQ